MMAPALILRELHSEARRPWNYWARAAAGGLITISFALATLPNRGYLVNGLNLFNGASVVVIALIWIVAPLLTADCLSREKREGTLGLLFLTPLTPAGVVVGKSVVHGLRASSLLLAGIPVLSLSMLFGGVALADVLLMLMHYLGALAVALAAGLIASAWSRDWLRSIILTACLTLAFGTIYYQGMSSVMLRRSTKGGAFLFVATLLLLGCATVLAAYRIRQSWQEGPPSKRVLWLTKTFCSPILWKEVFRRSSRQSLEKNPIGWLYERTATARATKWVWCCVAVFVSSAAVTSLGNAQLFVTYEIGLGLAMTFAGASSFRRERQTGVLELFLVAPLEIDQIIFGRLRAVVKQFAPAVAMIVVPLFGFALSMGQDLPGPNSFILPHCLFMLTSLGTLPALGLHASLRVPQFLTAWLLAGLIGLALPYYSARLLIPPGDFNVFGMTAIFQVIVATVAIKRFFVAAPVREQLARSVFARGNQ